MKNFLKQIMLVSKIKKSIKEAKKTVDKNKGLADDVKRKVKNLKLAAEDLLTSLPMLKPLYMDSIDIIKRFWK